MQINARRASIAAVSAGLYSLLPAALAALSIATDSAFAPSSLRAQAPSPFATRVVAFDDRGQAGGGIFNPANALGQPGGSTDVHSLGIGGSLTLGFDVVIVDGPGADLLIAENPFASTANPSSRC